MSDTDPARRPLYYEVNGRVVPPRQLVKLGEGRWVEPSPVRCPNGHPLGGGDATVGWIPCPGPDRNGHRTVRCHCEAVVYTPPRDTPHCACQLPRT